MGKKKKAKARLEWNSASQAMLDWLMGEDFHEGEEEGPTRRRRMVSEVVATGGNWPVVLGDRLESELASEIFHWAGNEIPDLDEFGGIGCRLLEDALFNLDWPGIALKVLEGDGFDTTAHLGNGVCNPRPAEEIEEYLARTAPDEVGAT